jgi:hypothetical protein
MVYTRNPKIDEMILNMKRSCLNFVLAIYPQVVFHQVPFPLSTVGLFV